MTYAINSNNQVGRFESKAAVQSRGNGWAIFGSAEELAGNKAVSTSDILEAFNALTGGNVKKFSDKLSGAKRLCKALDETEALGKIGGGTVDHSKSNETIDKAIKSGAIKPKRQKRAKRKDDAPEANTRARSSKLDGRTFQLHRRHLGINPRRKGSHGHRSLGLMIDPVAPKPRQIEYAQFLEEGGRAKDLRWDILHNNVEEVFEDGTIGAPQELIDQGGPAKE